MNYLHNGINVNINKHGQVVLSKKPLEGLPAIEWENLNTDVVTAAGYAMRVKDGICEEIENLITVESLIANESEIDIVYRNNYNNLKITEHIEFFSDLKALRQTTKVENEGNKPVTLESVSSAKALFVGAEGGKWHNDPKRFLLHYCKSEWQAEGQWRSCTLEDIGLFPATSHIWEKNSVKLHSFSSWSTSDFAPVIIIEDNEQQSTWFFTQEGAVNWEIGLSAFGGTASRGFQVSMSAACGEVGWNYTLNPGESYETLPAVYGLVDGCFEDAVCELTKYRRFDSKSNHDIPVVFNDYMNCNWGNPSVEKLENLITAAAKVGCEYFCIDAGWESDLGEWNISSEKFGNGKLWRIFDKIKESGMKPGLWFELCSCSRKFGEKHPTWLLKRKGCTVSEARPLIDFNNPEATEYITGAIGYLYKHGLRFIKDDCNRNTGVGCDGADSYAEGNRKNTEAYYRLIMQLKKKYPQLLIESCASGAMRSEHGTLRYFELQSLTDQENYLKIPSILVGTSALIEPEKLGVWAYPYPNTFDINSKGQILNVTDFTDGEQTIFNMVSGLVGTMYLSGRIDLCDDKNLSLISEAVMLSKKYKEFVRTSYPAYLCDMRRFSDNSYNALGLMSCSGEEMLLAVWNFEVKDFEFDLSNRHFDKCEMIYPSASENYSFEFSGKKLKVNAGNKNTARLFRVSKHEI